MSAWNLTNVARAAFLFVLTAGATATVSADTRPVNGVGFRRKIERYTATVGQPRLAADLESRLLDAYQENAEYEADQLLVSVQEADKIICEIIHDMMITRPEDQRLLRCWLFRQGVQNAAFLADDFRRSDRRIREIILDTIKQPHISLKLDTPGP